MTVPATFVTFGDYARHDGVYAEVTLDPMTGQPPPQILCLGNEPSDLVPVFVSDPRPTPDILARGILLDREPRTPMPEEKVKAQWRYVQPHRAKPEQPEEAPSE